MTTSGIMPMLSGIKVIDITQFVAGPTASRVLAEMGADVVKVELAPYGDRSRVQGVKAKDARLRTPRPAHLFLPAQSFEARYRARTSGTSARGKSLGA